MKPMWAEKMVTPSDFNRCAFDDAERDILKALNCTRHVVAWVLHVHPQSYSEAERAMPHIYQSWINDGSSAVDLAFDDLASVTAVRLVEAGWKDIDEWMLTGVVVNDKAEVKTYSVWSPGA